MSSCYNILSISGLADKVQEANIPDFIANAVCKLYSEIHKTDIMPSADDIIALYNAIISSPQKSLGGSSYLIYQNKAFEITNRTDGHFGMLNEIEPDTPQYNICKSLFGNVYSVGKFNINLDSLDFVDISNGEVNNLYDEKNRGSVGDALIYYMKQVSKTFPDNDLYRKFDKLNSLSRISLTKEEKSSVNKMAAIRSFLVKKHGNKKVVDMGDTLRGYIIEEIQRRSEELRQSTDEHTKSISNDLNKVFSHYGLKDILKGVWSNIKSDYEDMSKKETFIYRSLNFPIGLYNLRSTKYWNDLKPAQLKKVIAKIGFKPTVVAGKITSNDINEYFSIEHEKLRVATLDLLNNIWFFAYEIRNDLSKLYGVSIDIDSANGIDDEEIGYEDEDEAPQYEKWMKVSKTEKQSDRISKNLYNVLYKNYRRVAIQNQMVQVYNSFGQPIVVSPDETMNTLSNIIEKCVYPSQCYEALIKEKEHSTNAKDVIEALCDCYDKNIKPEIDNKGNFVVQRNQSIFSDFFFNFNTDFIPMVEGYVFRSKDNGQLRYGMSYKAGKETIKATVDDVETAINISEFRIDYSTLSRLNKSLYVENGRVAKKRDQDAFNRSQVLSFIDNYDNIIEDLANIINGMGVKNGYTVTKGKWSGKPRTLATLTTLNKAATSLNEFINAQRSADYRLGDSKTSNMLYRTFRVLGITTNTKTESSERINGKLKMARNKPSFAGKLSKIFNGDPEICIKYLEDNYMKDLTMYDPNGSTIIYDNDINNSQQVEREKDDIISHSESDTFKSYPGRFNNELLQDIYEEALFAKRDGRDMEFGFNLVSLEAYSGKDVDDWKPINRFQSHCMMYAYNRSVMDSSMLNYGGMLGSLRNDCYDQNATTSGAWYPFPIMSDSGNELFFRFRRFKTEMSIYRRFADVLRYEWEVQQLIANRQNLPKKDKWKDFDNKKNMQTWHTLKSLNSLLINFSNLGFGEIPITLFDALTTWIEKLRYGSMTDEYGEIGNISLDDIFFQAAYFALQKEYEDFINFQNNLGSFSDGNFYFAFSDTQFVDKVAIDPSMQWIDKEMSNAHPDSQAFYEKLKQLKDIKDPAQRKDAISFAIFEYLKDQDFENGRSFLNGSLNKREKYIQIEREINDYRSRLIGFGEIDKFMRMFFLNTAYAQSQFIQMTTGPLALYPDATAFQKRAKQFGAIGNRPNTKSLFGREYQRTVHLEDVEGQLAKGNNSILECMALQSKIGDGITSEQVANIVDDHENGVSQTDGQAFITLSAYRSIIDMTSGWTIEDQESYDRLHNGTWNIDDILKPYMPIKSYDYHMSPSKFMLDYNGVKEERYLMRGTQFKHSQGPMTSTLNNLPGISAKNLILQGLSEWMENNVIDSAQFTSTNKVAPRTGLPISEKAIQEWYNNVGSLDSEIKSYVEEFDGTDGKIVDSTVKTKGGGTRTIYKNGAILPLARMTVAYLEAMTNLKNRKKLNDKEIKQRTSDPSFYDSNDYIESSSYSDYMIPLAKPEHLVSHSKMAEGSQISKLIMADISNDAKLILNGRKISKDELLNLIFDLRVANITNNFLKAENVFSSNKKLSRELQKSMSRTGNYGNEALRAVEIDEKGNFIIPLMDVTNTRTIQNRLSSIINKKVLKQEMRGGTVVQMSCFGIADKFDITFQDINMNVISFHDEISKEVSVRGLSLERLSEEEYNTIKQDVIERLRTMFDNKEISLKDFEVAMSVHSKELLESIVTAKDGVLDYSVESVPEDLRTFIGYRVPTEDKYSMFVGRVKEFLPQTSGSVVIMPSEITLITGADFDIDVMYLLLKDFEIDYNRAKVKSRNLRSDLLSYLKMLKKRMNVQALEDYLNTMVDNNGAMIPLVEESFQHIVRSIYANDHGDYNEKKAIELDERLNEIVNYGFKGKEEQASLFDLLQKTIRNYFSYVGLGQHKVGKNMYVNPLSEIKYDYTNSASKQTQKQRNNALIDIYKSVLTSNDTMVKQLNPGNFDEQKKLSNAIPALQVGAEMEYDNLVTMTNQEVKKWIKNLDYTIQGKLASNLSSVNPATNNIFFQQNIVGSVMTSVFAFSNAAHAMMQILNSKLATDGMMFNGKEIRLIDGAKTLDMNSFISKVNGCFVAAAVDNGKTPTLAAMNMNAETANVTTFMIRAGFQASEIAILLSQPSIVGYVTKRDSKNDFESKARQYSIERNTWFALGNAMAMTNEGFQEQWEKIAKERDVEVDDLHCEDLIKEYSNPNPITQLKALKIYNIFDRYGRELQQKSLYYRQDRPTTDIFEALSVYMKVKTLEAKEGDIQMQMVSEMPNDIDTSVLYNKTDVALLDLNNISASGLQILKRKSELTISELLVKNGLLDEQDIFDEKDRSLSINSELTYAIFDLSHNEERLQFISHVLNNNDSEKNGNPIMRTMFYLGLCEQIKELGKQTPYASSEFMTVYNMIASYTDIDVTNPDVMRQIAFDYQLFKQYKYMHLWSEDEFANMREAREYYYNGKFRNFMVSLQNKAWYKNNALLKRLKWSRGKGNGRKSYPVETLLYFNQGSESSEDRIDIERAWMNLYSSKDLDQKKLAMQLFYYLLIKNGADPADGYNIFIPTEVKLEAADYVESMRIVHEQSKKEIDKPEPDMYNFLIQFIRNNINNYKLQKRIAKYLTNYDYAFVGQNVTIDASTYKDKSTFMRGRGAVKSYSEQKGARFHGVIKVKQINNSNKYNYYVLLGQRGDVASYGLVTPLGWYDKKYKEYDPDDNQAFVQSAIQANNDAIEISQIRILTESDEEIIKNYLSTVNPHWKVTASDINKFTGKKEPHAQNIADAINEQLKSSDDSINDEDESEGENIDNDGVDIHDEDNMFRNLTSQYEDVQYGSYVDNSFFLDPEANPIMSSYSDASRSLLFEQNHKEMEDLIRHQENLRAQNGGLSDQEIKQLNYSKKQEDDYKAMLKSIGLTENQAKALEGMEKIQKELEARRKDYLMQVKAYGFNSIEEFEEAERFRKINEENEKIMKTLSQEKGQVVEDPKCGK